VLERRQALVALLATGAAACLAAPRVTGGAAASAAAAAPSAPLGRTVVIEGMVYTPSTFTVGRGERVTWVNRDLVAHTVTAADGSFDSGSIAAGASWSTVATRAGRLAYACTFHPTMTATLDVR